MTCCNCAISCLFTFCECSCHYGETVTIAEPTNTVYVVYYFDPEALQESIEFITFSKLEAEEYREKRWHSVEEFEVRGKPDE